MFGYVNIFKPELKVKDYNQYKAYYCGLCRMLGNKYGPLGKLTLTYDMTFLVILLTSLYESDNQKLRKRCPVHPIQKQNMLCNRMTEYAADMNIALMVHHFQDDWDDDRSLTGLVGTKIFHRAYKKVFKRYPRQCRVIEEHLNQLATYEKSGETDLDRVSGCFGELMAELFVYQEDIWEEQLRSLGFYLGKFIYILDAYMDLDEDAKRGNYNPLLQISRSDCFHEDCEQMLTLMMAAASSEFEKLPCLLEVDILRNILYVGVWTKFDSIKCQNNMKEGINNNDRSV